MSIKPEDSEDVVEGVSGKNRNKSSDKEDHKMDFKLEADDEAGSDIGIDTTEKGMSRKKDTRFVSKADLEEGEVFSEEPNDGNVDRDGDKKKTNDVISSNKENTKTPGMFQELSNDPLKKVVSNHIWVSNINRNVKAADLKRFFGKMGKVCTAKILTNGRYFYGYITMENALCASKCIRQLNNCLFEGEKIVVSKSRPDLRDTKMAVKDTKTAVKDTKTAVKDAKTAARDTKAGVKDTMAAVQDSKVAVSKPEVIKKKHVKVEEKRHDDIFSSKNSTKPCAAIVNHNEKHSEEESDDDVISISSSKMSDVKESNDAFSVKLSTRKNIKSSADRKRDTHYTFEKRGHSYHKSIDKKHVFYHEQERTINEFRKEINMLHSENEDLKQKLDDYQRRHNSMRMRCTSLERDLKKIRYESNEDRQRLNEEKENFEKKKKSELARIELDRAAVAKEFAENRKLKDQLKFRIEELKSATAKMSKRNRSPVLRNVRSPPPNRSSNDHFRNERAEKRPRHDEISRVRTPPSPQDVMADSVRKRGHDTNHPLYNDTAKRQSPVDHQFEYRRKPPFRNSMEASKPEWTNNFPKETRRSHPVPAFFGNSRYTAEYPQANPNINVPLKNSHNPHYYSQW